MELTITFSSLKQGISTLTRAPSSASNGGGRRRFQTKLWNTARVDRNASRPTPSAMALMNRKLKKASM